jgi:hypothetical protein
MHRLGCSHHFGTDGQRDFFCADLGDTSWTWVHPDRVAVIMDCAIIFNILITFFV